LKLLCDFIGLFQSGGDEVAVTGAPYQEGDLWYVPVEIRIGSGKSETQNAMIKFYEFEGKTLCFIIGSKEKGVVD